jgi:hypothetical protein
MKWDDPEFLEAIRLIKSFVPEAKPVLVPKRLRDLPFRLFDDDSDTIVVFESGEAIIVNHDQRVCVLPRREPR